MFSNWSTKISQKCCFAKIVKFTSLKIQYLTHLQFNMVLRRYYSYTCNLIVYTDHECSSTVDIYKIYVSKRRPLLDTLTQDSMLNYEKPSSYCIYSFGSPMVSTNTSLCYTWIQNWHKQWQIAVKLLRKSLIIRRILYQLHSELYNKFLGPKASSKVERFCNFLLYFKINGVSQNSNSEDFLWNLIMKTISVYVIMCDPNGVWIHHEKYKFSLVYLMVLSTQE